MKIRAKITIAISLPKLTAIILEIYCIFEIYTICTDILNYDFITYSGV